MLLFLAGMGLDFSLLRKYKKTLIIISTFSILLPFIVGVSFANYYFNFLHGIEISAAPYVFQLIFGIMISMSALLIVSRIVLEHHLMITSLAITILGSALVADLVGWVAFSSVLIYANAAIENIQILYALLYITVFFIVMYFISNKNFVTQFFIHKNNKEDAVSYDISSLFGICLLMASFTNAIHIHSTLGAFLAGIICKRILGNNSTIVTTELFIMNFFAPLFFISIGLKLNFIEHFNIWMGIVIFLIACSKGISAYIGARLCGFQSKPARTVGFVLNARGFMPIIMSSLALKMGLIGQQLFVAFIVIAIVTIFSAEIAILRSKENTN